MTAQSPFTMADWLSRLWLDAFDTLLLSRRSSVQILSGLYTREDTQVVLCSFQGEKAICPFWRFIRDSKYVFARLSPSSRLDLLRVLTGAVSKARLACQGTKMLVACACAQIAPFVNTISVESKSCFQYIETVGDREPSFQISPCGFDFYLRFENPRDQDYPFK